MRIEYKHNIPETDPRDIWQLPNYSWHSEGYQCIAARCKSVHLPDPCFGDPRPAQLSMRRILELIAAYIAPMPSISYGKLVELLGVRYRDIYPVLFNVTACAEPPEDDQLMLMYDCNAAAAKLLKELKGP